VIEEDQSISNKKSNLNQFEKKNSNESMKDIVMQEILPQNSKISPKKNNIDRKEILKNLAENSFNVNVEHYKTLNKIDEIIQENQEKDTKILDKNTKQINNMKVELKCCLSHVDRGNAIFVTNRDIIFKLPRPYLPNNYIKGNSFKITIEETETSNKKYEKIRCLQNKHLFK
jgi:hypothetical protein